MIDPLAHVTVTVQALHLLLAGAQARGMTPAEALTDCELDPAVIGDIDARVPASLVLGLWQSLPKRLNQPDFGLFLAELALRAPVGSLGEHLVVSAATFGAGLSRLLAFERVVHGVNPTSLELRDDLARIEHRPPFGAGPGTEPAIEFAFAWLVGTARRTTGRPVLPVSVQFTHAPKAELARYEQVFGVTPAFGKSASGAPIPVSVLELRASDLALPQRTQDTLVSQLVERHARALLREMPADTSQAARLRAYLVAQLSCGELATASLSRAALSLGLPERSLQRRLSAEGTSYQAVLDEVRYAAALEYLTERRTALAEIAFMLGFADEGAFHRAFQRWAGMTPGEQRRQSG